MPKTATLNKTKKESFYSDSSDEESNEELEEPSENEVEEVELDEDHSLLIKSCLPLLQSRNSGVRFSKLAISIVVTRLTHYCRLSWRLHAFIFTLRRQKKQHSWPNLWSDCFDLTENFSM